MWVVLACSWPVSLTLRKDFDNGSGGSIRTWKKKENSKAGRGGYEIVAEGADSAFLTSC